MSTKYVQRYDGQRWKIASVHTVQCCDCGLVHTYRLRRRGRYLYKTAWRLTRATAAVRRGKKFAGLKLPKKAQR